MFDSTWFKSRRTKSKYLVYKNQTLMVKLKINKTSTKGKMTKTKRTKFEITITMKTMLYLLR